jgi:heptosyltransferase-3
MSRHSSLKSLRGRPSILVARTDRLGDVILTLPVVSVLRDHLPHARLGMLLRHYTGQIVQGNPDLDEILWYDDERGPVPFFRMLRTLRQKRFDVVIVARPELRLALLMACARVPIRVGTAFRFYSVLFTHRVFEHRRFAEKHEVEYNVALLKPLEVPLDATSLRFPIRIEPSERDAVEARLQALGMIPGRKRVILHPGSGGSAREWPVGRFAELGQRLQHRGDVQVLVTGTAGEHWRVEEVVRGAGPPALDLAGQWSVRELAAVISGAELFVSNSTGPLHLAAALGIPVLAFYPTITPMSARRWGPYTPHAEVLEASPVPECPACSGGNPLECRCMESISVDRAFAAAQRLMEPREYTREHSVTHV